MFSKILLGFVIFVDFVKFFRLKTIFFQDFARVSHFCGFCQVFSSENDFFQEFARVCHFCGFC